MRGSCHIRSVEIGVQYWNGCQILNLSAEGKIRSERSTNHAKMPPQKRVAKTRNPKRRKKLLAPARKIKEEAASEQEAKKLSSPVRKHQSSRSGKAISKLHLQKHNARTCKNYKQITTDTGTRTVREALPFKAKGKPAKGEHKKHRKSDMLKVIRAQDQEYAGKHLRPYFNGWFYQPRLAAANRRLTETTLPELKATKWVPINKRTGAGGYLPKTQKVFKNDAQTL